MDDGPGGAVVPPRLHEHRAAGPAAEDVRVVALAAVGRPVEVRRGKDLGQGAGLLVGRAARERLAEHRLGLGTGVALLLSGTQAAVVPFAHRLDGRVEPEDRALARTVRAAIAARVEEAEVVRPHTAVAVRLALGQRLNAVGT